MKVSSYKTSFCQVVVFISWYYLLYSGKNFKNMQTTKSYQIDKQDYTSATRVSLIWVTLHFAVFWDDHVGK